jgi:predicted negative regulator of RcsB-dependent stress response
MAGPYDFEEQERIAELKAWWEDNRLALVGALVAAALGFAGYKGWQHWTQSKAEDASLMFVPVSSAAKAKDAKKIDEGAKALMEKHPGSFHASEAALFAAKAAFDAGRNAEAREKLEWVVKNGVKDLQGVARLRLAAVLLDEKKYPEALTVLDGNKDDAFVALVADMRGDIMLAQGRLEEARASYRMAIDKAEPRNPVKNIAEVKLNALGGTK